MWDGPCALRSENSASRLNGQVLIFLLSAATIPFSPFTQLCGVTG
jgi:hypothetical protein